MVDAAGNIGIGTRTPNEQLEITKNLRLPSTTATTGIIKSDGNPFIHNFGNQSFFAGVDAGNQTLTGEGNTGVGVLALTNTTHGHQNTAAGVRALTENTSGFSNTGLGWGSLQFNDSGNRNTAVGHSALRSNVAGAFNTAVGYQSMQDNLGSENAAFGVSSLARNTSGTRNTAMGESSLSLNTVGDSNTALGSGALFSNGTGSQNTAVGNSSNVSDPDLNNATAIGAGAIVDASNKVRLGDANVTVIEGKVAFSFTSDVNEKENFRAVDGEETLEQISQMTLESWNYIGHDPLEFRHYGPTAQEFFAAFGEDGFGVVGTDVAINSGDFDGIMLIAIQALEKRTAQVSSLEQQLVEQQAALQDLLDRLKALEGSSTVGAASD